jgi:hypothetical protein
MQTKRCPKCGEDKPLDGFYKNKCKGDGFSVYCMDCARVLRKEYYEKHQTECKNSNKRYYNSHKLESRARGSKYYRNHRSHLNITTAQWRKREKAKLSDVYIKLLLRSQGISSPSPELIELKRQAVVAQQILKECQKRREHESDR